MYKTLKTLKTLTPTSGFTHPLQERHYSRVSSDMFECDEQHDWVLS